MNATVNGKQDPLAALRERNRESCDNLIARARDAVEATRRQKEVALDEVARLYGECDALLAGAEEEAERLLTNHVRDVRVRASRYAAATCTDEGPLDPEFRVPPAPPYRPVSQTEQQLPGFDPAPLDARKVPAASIAGTPGKLYVPRELYDRFGAAHATVAVPHVNGVAMATVGADDDTYVLTDAGLGVVGDVTANAATCRAAESSMTHDETKIVGDPTAQPDAVDAILDRAIESAAANSPTPTEPDMPRLAPAVGEAFDEIARDAPSVEPNEAWKQAAKSVSEPPPKPPASKRGGKKR